LEGPHCRQGGQLGHGGGAVSLEPIEINHDDDLLVPQRRLTHPDRT
jgi:hypothetical protein